MIDYKDTTYYVVSSSYPHDFPFDLVIVIVVVLVVVTAVVDVGVLGRCA